MPRNLSTPLHNPTPWADDRHASARRKPRHEASAKSRHETTQDKRSATARLHSPAGGTGLDGYLTEASERAANPTRQTTHSSAFSLPSTSQWLGHTIFDVRLLSTEFRDVPSAMCLLAAMAYFCPGSGLSEVTLSMETWRW